MDELWRRRSNRIRPLPEAPRPENPTPIAGSSTLPVIPPFTWQSRQQYTQALLDTPEWKEYRLSSYDKHPEDALLYRAEERYLPYAPSDTHSETPNTSRSTSDHDSTRGLFHRRRQAPVDAIDLLQVVLENLQLLEQHPEGKRNYRPRQLESAINRLKKIIETLQTPPEHPAGEPVIVRTFATFLRNRIQELRKEVLDLRNLADPDYIRNLEKLDSFVRSNRLHQQFLRTRE